MRTAIRRRLARPWRSFAALVWLAVAVAVALSGHAELAYGITWCHDWTLYKVTGKDGDRQPPSQLEKALVDAGYTYYDSFHVTDAAKFDDTKWIDPDAVKIGHRGTPWSVASDHRLFKGDVILVGQQHSGVVADDSGRIDHFLQPPTVAEGQGKVFAAADAERDGNFKRGWTLPQIMLFERRIFPANGPSYIQHPYLRDEVKIYRPRDPRWGKLMQVLTDQGLQLTDGRGNPATGTVTVAAASSDAKDGVGLTTSVSLNTYGSEAKAREAFQALAPAGAAGGEAFDVAGGKGVIGTAHTDIPDVPPAELRKWARARATYTCGDALVRVECLRDVGIAPAPRNADEKTKFLSDLARLEQETKALARERAAKIDGAMAADHLCTGVDRTTPIVTLDRPDGARFSAVRVSGLGFAPTRSSTDTVHVNIMWDGKEVYRINATDVQGRIPAAWVHVPDDAPFGVNKVWGEEGATGRKSQPVEFTVNKLTVKELVDSLDGLTKIYLNEIPGNDRWYAYFRSGMIRNAHNAGRSVAAGLLWLPTAIFTLGHYQDELWPDNKFVCSWYQAETLELLNRLRFSMDPSRRAVVDGLDYGPFMSGATDVPWLSHHFVVVWPHVAAMDPGAVSVGGFPRDPMTAFQTTGIAFDPWPPQTPALFEVKGGSAAWAESSPFADRWKRSSYWYILPRPTPDKVATDGKPLFKGQYPITGGDYYETNFRTAADLRAILKDARAEEPSKMVAVRSPVRVEMKDAKGAAAGKRADGTEFNDLPGCQIALAKQPDGHDEWYADLPDGTITVTITGTGDGAFTLLTKHRGQPAQQYPAVPIHNGSVSTIVLTDGSQPEPLHGPDGKDLLPGAAATPTTQPRPGAGGTGTVASSGGSGQPSTGPSTAPSSTGGVASGGMAGGVGGGVGPGAGGTGIDLGPGTATGGTGTAGAGPTGGGTAGTGTAGTGTIGTGTAGGGSTGTGTAGTGTASGGTGTGGTAGGTSGTGTNGAGPVAAGGGPDGVSVGKNLTAARWHTLRRITHFQRGEDAKFIRATKISGNGARIAFAAQQGFFTLGPDGSNLVRLSDKPCQLMDISRDGNKVAWYEGPNALFVANADGSAKETLPGGMNIASMRLTADGSKLFVLVPEKDGIFVLPSDGSDVKKVMATAPVCKLLNTETNANHWRTLDVSDDGSRLAFNVLNDLFTCNGDGSDLRQVTHFKQYAVSPSGYRISGDGRKVVHFRAAGADSAMVFGDVGGGGEVVFPQPNVEVHSLAPSGDGSRVAASWGVRLFDADGKTFYDALDTGAHAVHNPYSISMTDDFRRAVVQVDGPASVDQGAPSQLAVIDFNPPALVNCPALRDVTAKPKFLPNDGSTAVTLSANAGDPELKQIGTVFVRNGREDPDLRTYFGLVDNASAGDAKAGDGIYTNNALLIHTNSGKPFPPGPVTLRLHAMDKAGNITVVDLDGLEVRQP